MSVSAKLPSPDVCEYRFIGEGAANVIFDVLYQPGLREKDDQRPFEGFLLRVPKAGTNAHHYADMHAYWESTILPAFSSEELVKQYLVRLDKDGGTIAHLNAVLREHETTRRADFRGSRVADVEFGMLVENMNKTHPSDIVIEFKPKWLAQSPNASSSAIRCRNCARSAHKLNTKPTTKSLTPCPLHLLNPSTVDPIPPSSPTPIIIGSTTIPPSSPHHLLLSQWLRTNTLLPRLRDLQIALDPSGPLAANSHDPKFQLAMTLRDCSCFVRIHEDPSQPVEARLGDLDMKNWDAKLGYWQAMERTLVEAGYYAGTEEPRVETNCLLERRLGVMRESAGDDWCVVEMEESVVEMEESVVEM